MYGLEKLMCRNSIKIDKVEGLWLTDLVKCELAH